MPGGSESEGLAEMVVRGFFGVGGMDIVVLPYETRAAFGQIRVSRAALHVEARRTWALCGKSDPLRATLRPLRLIVAAGGPSLTPPDPRTATGPEPMTRE